MAINEADNALVLALVSAHLLTDCTYLSWVPAYTKVRWSRGRDRCVCERVGEHWRRRANCKKALDSMACVCKYERHAAPGKYEPPTGNKRRR